MNGDVEGMYLLPARLLWLTAGLMGLLAAARTVRLNGQVSGNVRCAAQDVEINGNVGMSLTAAGDQIRLLERFQGGSGCSGFRQVYDAFR